MSAPAAFVSVPLVTCRSAPNDPSVSLRVIVPLFVNPEAIVRLPAPKVLLPWTRMSEAAPVETVPFSADPPSMKRALWLTHPALIALVRAVT